MTYNGLGQRLSMNAGGVTTQYALDNGQVLEATSGGQTTVYLYGMGPVGQLTDTWAYDLADGTNTPRQLTDAQGEVTYAARYTPWGDTLETHGTGNISFGYLGGLMDTATGLNYMGNGQYYDPATGRFLNRNTSPNSTNPYIPWPFQGASQGGNPSAALMAPLALLSLIYSRKRKRGKLDAFIILLVIGTALSMSLAACTPSGSETIENQYGTATVTWTQTPVASTYSVTGNINGTPITGNVTITPTGTPLPPPELPSGCATPTLNYTDAQWNGIVNVLWFEGASSFGGASTENVFTKQLWALRSEGKYDSSLQGWTFWQIVQSDRYSANAHFNDQGHQWPNGFKNLAKRILSDQVSPTPAAYDHKAIYTISTTQFPRLASKELNGSSKDLPQKITSTNQNMPAKCYNGSFCAFPEIRWRNNVKGSSVDSVDRGIDLPKSSYNLYYNTYHLNQYDECYWIGLYFTTWEVHENLFNQSNNLTNPTYPPPNFDPISQDASSLRCPSDINR